MAHTKLHKSNRRKENRPAYKDYARGSIERKDAKQEIKSEKIFNLDGPLAKIRQKRWAKKMQN
jgi:hypothetical protein